MWGEEKEDSINIKPMAINIFQLIPLRGKYVVKIGYGTVLTTSKQNTAHCCNSRITRIKCIIPVRSLGNYY